MTTDPDLARKLNEVLGMAAATLAVVASLPGVTPDVIKSARSLMGGLIPSPAPNSPGGSAPPHFAVHALERIESIAASLAKVRAAGGS